MLPEHLWLNKEVHNLLIIYVRKWIAKTNRFSTVPGLGNPEAAMISENDLVFL